MPELTERHLQMIEETHEIVLKDHTTLFGQNGDRGLIGKVDDACAENKKIGERHSKLNRNFWILVAFLAGSGVLGGSIWALLH